MAMPDETSKRRSSTSCEPSGPRILTVTCDHAQRGPKGGEGGTRASVLADISGGALKGPKNV